MPAARKRYGRPFDISPKDLRKTCINLLTSARVPDQWQEAYIGHAAYTTIRKHYLDSTVDQLRQAVLAPLQAMIIQIEDSVPGKKLPKTRAELIASDEIKSDEDEMEDRTKDLMGWPD